MSLILLLNITLYYFIQSAGIKIKNFLKVEKARKWCIYEWFYSDIDKTIFLQDNEFVSCLRATFPDLQPGTKLTQLQWSVVRRSLGKPRRCSSKFFQVSHCVAHTAL